MNTIFKTIASLSGVAVIGLILGSCTANPDSAGLEYMPDMYRSPAIEPYVDYGEVKNRVDENKANTLSALTPPSRTIPYYGTDSSYVMMMLPYKRKPSTVFAVTHGLFDEDYSTNPDPDFEYHASAADINPLKLTYENVEQIMAKGKSLYATKCLHCHGEKGDGNGPMVTAGSYTGAADLTSLDLADGQKFYSIYYGKGMMGAHRSLLNKKEIWTVIHYINKFKNADYGTFGDNGTAAVSDSTKTVK